MIGLVGRQSHSPLLQLKIDPVRQMCPPSLLAFSEGQRIFINIRGHYGIQKNIYIHSWLGRIPFLVESSRGSPAGRPSLVGRTESSCESPLHHVVASLRQRRAQSHWSLSHCLHQQTASTSIFISRTLIYQLTLVIKLLSPREEITSAQSCALNCNHALQANSMVPFLQSSWKWRVENKYLMSVNWIQIFRCNFENSNFVQHPTR